MAKKSSDNIIKLSKKQRNEFDKENDRLKHEFQRLKDHGASRDELVEALTQLIGHTVKLARQLGVSKEKFKGLFRDEWKQAKLNDAESKNIADKPKKELAQTTP